MPGLRDDRKIGESLRGNIGRHFAQSIPVLQKNPHSTSKDAYAYLKKATWDNDREAPNVPSEN
jgi:hypothetical protein